MNAINYQLNKLIKLSFNLFTLKAKPEELPYSQGLLWLLLLLNYAAKYLVNKIGHWIFNSINPQQAQMLYLTMFESLLVFSATFLLLGLLIYSALDLMRKKNRFVQLCCSLLIADIGLTILLAFCLLSLKFSGLIAVIFFILLIYWEFVLYIYIFVNSFDIGYIKAGIFALVYMVLLHNISEWLMYYLNGVG